MLNKHAKKTPIVFVCFLMMLSGCDGQKPVASLTDNGESKMASQMAQNNNTTQHSHDKHHADMAKHSQAYHEAMQNMHQDMNNAYSANNADVIFMQGMLPHHQGAVAMAKIQLQYGEDLALKDLAQTIIDAQQSEINQIKAWLQAHQNTKTKDEQIDKIRDDYLSKDKITHDEMMTGIMDTDADRAFVKGMIPHHQGAIDMADLALKYSSDNEVLALAKQIKATQIPEIAQMKAWLDATH